MPETAGLTLPELQVQAAEATARGSKSFYFATRFFPPELAQAAHAVYWFCRYTDDLVDETPSIETGTRDLEAWADELQRGLRGQAVVHPVLRLFLRTLDRYQIPGEYPLELIEGMRMDLRCTRYQNFDELRVFCYRVASVVGLMMSHVIGFRGEAPSHAIDLGIAMQLTNILRDVGEDLQRGRIYLPTEELAAHGYSEDELRRGVRNDAFRSLMQFQVSRARQYYQEAMPGISLLHPDGRFAVKVAADVYRAILGRIEAADYDVFSQRAVVPARTKYWLTARSMAVPAARHSLLRMLAVWRG
ncbi:MAG: phytoene/squalene synthase family protein [Bryobacterales bacterium]|nr:phytoene/squalene synthase family protein [Bryobacterales bacterium]